MKGNGQTAATMALSVTKPAVPASSGLAGLSPGCFALVMATGIVSLALDDQGWRAGALALFWLNLAAYLVLWVLTLLRFFRHRARFMDDLTHHFHSAAFLTIVAGTCVLGCQFALLTPWMAVAKGLWFFGIGSWVVLNYTFFAVVTIRNPKPTLAAAINGVWLLTVVATEAISVLGTLVAPHFTRMEWAHFVSLSAGLAGAMFYLFLITLILYRWMFFRMRPAKLTPDYWIDMGALAIATLAGAFELSAAGQWSLLRELTPFLAGFTLLFWTTATWWIPLLLIVEIWRHTVGRVKWVYSPDYWSLVFPLGMYSTATHQLAKALDLPFLFPIAAFFAWVALLAWALTFLGLLRHRMRCAPRPAA